MKKLMALILTFAMLLVFASCGEKNEAESLADTTAGAETTAAVTAAKYLKASDEDFGYLSNIVHGILRSTPNGSPVFDNYDGMAELADLVRNSSAEDYKDKYFYNSSSESALADAMYMMWNQKSMGFYHFTDVEVECESFDRYADYDETGETREFSADPKGMFTDDFGYVKLNADQIDFILENILCVEPDRTKTDDDFDTAGYYGVFDYYYSDGFYYFQLEEGGGGGKAPEIVDYSEQSDGSYIVTLSSYNESDTTDHFTGGLDEDYVYIIYEASAALKEVDGKRVWAVSYVKPVEYVLNVK